MPDLEELRKSLDEFKDNYIKDRVNYVEWSSKLRADLDNLLEAHRDRFNLCGEHKSSLGTEIKEAKERLRTVESNVAINTKLLWIAIFLVPTVIVIIANVILKLT